jgi:hypothetical protein
MRLTAGSFGPAIGAAILLLVLPVYWEFAGRSTPHRLLAGFPVVSKMIQFPYGSALKRSKEETHEEQKEHRIVLR